MKSPPDLTTNLSLTEPQVWVMFNKDMNSTSVRTNTFLRTACNQSVPLQQGSPAYNPNTRTVTILPTALVPYQQYVARVTSSATDLEGNPLQAAEIWRFTTGEHIDNFAPIFDGVQTITVNSSTELILRWSAAVDDIDQATPQDQLEYLIYQGTSAVCDQGQVNFSTPLRTLKSADVCQSLDEDPSTRECSYKIGSLSANTKYCFAVRTRDRGCHIDGNRKIVQDTTKVGGRLYVANLGLNNLLVFDNAGEAEKVSPRVIRSNQTQLNVPIGLALVTLPQANQPPKKSLYVANFRSNSILAYDWQEGSQTPSFPSGDVLPRVLGGGLSFLSQPIGLFADSSNDRLYVSNYNTNAIVVFEGVSGITSVNTPPRRIVITSDPSNFIPYDNPIGIAVDTTRDILYVAYQTTSNIAIVDEVSKKGSGNIPPTRLISKVGTFPDNTRLSNPRGIWLDPDPDGSRHNGRLYVMNRGTDSKNTDDAILVFDNAATINGNVPPTWIINGTDTQFNLPYMLSMVSYEENSTTKHRLFVANSGDGKILVFNDIDAALNEGLCQQDVPGVSPWVCSPSPSLIVGGAKTQLSVPRGVFAENQTNGDTLYISNGGPFSTYSINVFEKLVIPQTPLDRKPDRMISPSIHGPTGVTVDRESETLYVSNILGNSISAFQDINNTSTAGNIRPNYRIFGSETRLNAPAGLALAGDRLFVSNLFANNILEFDLGDLSDPVKCPTPPDCNIGPVNSSSYSESGVNLRSPLGIAVDPGDDPLNVGDEILYVSYRDQNFADNKGNSIVVFQRNTSGGFDPFRRIESPNTLIGPAGLYLDTYRHELYVANRSANTIQVFDVRDETLQDVCPIALSTVSVCNLTPVRTITTNTQAVASQRLSSPNWVFLDDFSDPNKLYVSNRDNSVILVYNEAEIANGAVVQARTLGPSSGLNIPLAIFLDPRK